MNDSKAIEQIVNDYEGSIGLVHGFAARLEATRFEEAARTIYKGSNQSDISEAQILDYLKENQTFWEEDGTEESFANIEPISEEEWNEVFNYKGGDIK